MHSLMAITHTVRCQRERAKRESQRKGEIGLRCGAVESIFFISCRIVVFSAVVISSVMMRVIALLLLFL
jgi:hypothetical protein